MSERISKCDMKSKQVRNSGKGRDYFGGNVSADPETENYIVDVDTRADVVVYETPDNLPRFECDCLATVFMYPPVVQQTTGTGELIVVFASAT